MTESLEELEEAGDDWKALEMPAANLGVLKKPDTNWKTLEMSGSLEELEKPMMLEGQEKSETLEELEKPTTMLETLQKPAAILEALRNSPRRGDS